MPAGWRLSKGEIKNHFANERDLWASFRYVFSDACSKRTTYKFGLIKAILDNILSVVKTNKGMELLFDDLFYKFAANYWNLITKYNLKQMRATTNSYDSEIEKVFYSLMVKNNAYKELEFDSLSSEDKKTIISEVSRLCRKYVFGALYEDFKGQLYGFDLLGTGIWISCEAYDFMLQYKPEIEQLNYYAWAKFLEKINSEDVLLGVLGKLEKATPQRTDLSVYRQILWTEFEENNCFYCGCKLNKTPHVDHVIPWSFIKSDHLWNFVLACPKCNIRKNDCLPSTEEIAKVITRNEQLRKSTASQIEHEFRGYSADLLWQVWNYAKQSGLKTRV